ncbi:MAG: hypothetical protein VR72_19380 [Clostridiaceae bacterium BRH_c20a]|nr:MAG: hypothetical protein VR72_19380 [Clostridiaceae bacterium BRH_c20a]
MEIGCPVCNGLLSIGELCENCRDVMEDQGRIEDFYSPYSPYEEQDGIPLLQELPGNCIHLFSCTNCEHEQQIIVPLERM